MQIEELVRAGIAAEAQKIIGEMMLSDVQFRREVVAAAARKIALTEADACKLTGLSRETLCRARQAGELEFTRIGVRVIYLPEWIEAWVRAHRNSGAATRRGINNRNGGKR